MEATVKAGVHSNDILKYFLRELPSISINSSDLLEVIYTILIGTKETRYGSIPPPEHLVKIREVIKNAIYHKLSIPILVPFGGIKADKSGHIDVAEFNAIQRLVSLYKCIQKYYTPSIHVNVRIENINAMYLYGVESTDSIVNYSQNLFNLIKILGKDTEIHPTPESTLIDFSQYTEAAGKIYPSLIKFLLAAETDGDYYTALSELKNLGWKGEIPREQREFYIDRYSRLYPGLGMVDYSIMMAKYFAGSKARYDLNANMVPATAKQVGGFIQLNYTQPVPGAPTTMFNNTLYYRTLPLSEARTHMPAWRSKGYLKLDEHGNAKSKITNFHDKQVIDNLLEADTVIGDGINSVTIKTDYLL